METTTNSFNSEKKNVSKAAGIVGFYTFLSRILGLVRDIVIANVFGAKMAMDAFVMAFTIPNILRRLFAEGSLTIAFIPVFTEYLHIKSKEDAFELARIIFTLLSIILVFTTILGIILAPWIIRIQAFGFGIETAKYDLTVLITRITFPYIFLISIVAFFMGILNSLKHFVAPAAAPILLNVGIIASTLWISPHLSQPILGTAIGVIIGGILQVLLQLPWVFKNKVSLLPTWNPKHEAVKRIGILMVPAIFSSAIFQFNTVINRFLASFLVEGSISWLYLADRIFQFPLGIFAIALSTAALPSLSKQIAQKDVAGFNDTLNHTLKLTFFIIIPSMTGLIVLGEPILRLLFERNEFGSLDTVMTARALSFYLTGLWAVSGVKIVVPAYYALQDAKTPVKVAAVALIVNFICGSLLMGPLKHGGLALAPSIASAFNFCLLVFFLKRKLDSWSIKPVIISIVKYLISSIIMGIVVYFLYSRFLTPDQFSSTMNTALTLFCVIIIGTIIYFIITRILGCRESSYFIDMFKSLIRTNKGR